MKKLFIVVYNSTAHPGKEYKRDSNTIDFVNQLEKHDGWHYDIGDDPSFYKYKNGSQLTWGICRRDVRNQLNVGDVVIFFSFCRDCKKYSLAAIATVKEKIKHTYIWEDTNYSYLKGHYNQLLSKRTGEWVNDEPLYNIIAHQDWLHRMSRGRTFLNRLDNLELTLRLDLNDNYIIFDELDSYVLHDQITVATLRPDFEDGKHERWESDPVSLKIKNMIFSLTTRTSLRCNKYQNAHRHIRIDISETDLIKFKKDFIDFLKKQELNLIKA